MVFASPDHVLESLAEQGYLADARIAQVVYLSFRLDKPVLVEGPAGVGKTELAKAVAAATGRPLIRLQCYEGLDESKALYEWNYRKQLLRLQAASGEGWAEVESDIFDEDYLLTRPLLAAIRAEEPAVLLIDEVDRVEMETEALMLEMLADFQVSIPELGTIRASTRPAVFLTSNNTRELSEALKRRCLYLHIGYPTIEREIEILTTRVPDLEDELGGQVARFVAAVRGLPVRKPPSVSESIDWARALVELGIGELGDGRALPGTLNVLLKHQGDIDIVDKELTADLAGS
jgi:MoxR-like ATPase